MLSNEFKVIVAKLIEPALVLLGYEVVFNPPGYEEEGNIWFEKELDEVAHLVIDFQPSGNKPNRVSSFTINLARNNPSYTYYSTRDPLPGYFLGERLAPAIWIQDRHDPDWTADFWWHFQSVDSLHEACKDARAKLLTYGIPYLENLNSRSIRLDRQGNHNEDNYKDSGVR